MPGRDFAALAKLAVFHVGIEAEVDQKALASEAQARLFEVALDKIAIGVCFFDGQQRLILANRSYARIYGLTAEEVRPGTAFHDIVERRFEVGTSPLAPGIYLQWCASINSGGATKVWNAELKDGRTIRVCHEPMPDGGWVSSHEDITELKANRAATSERMSLQTLIDLVPDYLWVKDKKSRFIVANRAIALDSGRPNTAGMLGLTDFDLHSPEMAQAFRSIEAELLRSGQSMIDQEERIVDASGAVKWLSSSKVPLRNQHDEIVGLVGIARDITARKRADALRNGQARILEMIATSAPLLGVLEELMHVIEDQLDGIAGSILLVEGKQLRHCTAPNLPKAYIEAIEGTPIGPTVGSCGTAAFRREPVIVSDTLIDPLWDDFRELAKSYGLRSCWSTPIMSSQGVVLGVFAMYSATVRLPNETETRLIDTATRIAGIAIERKLAEEQVNFLAHHDALTGLPNRILLTDRLGQAILHGQRDGRWEAVVFADLDNFKLINDSLGHDAGDTLLKAVAKRMTDSVRATDSVVRLGGDEFVIVLVDQPDGAQSVLAAVEKLRAAVSAPILISGQSLRVTCSIGVATYPDDGADPDTLLRNADTAMYQAKSLGRDNYQFFTAAMNTQVHDRLSMQEELRTAMARSEFHLVYQPQVDLDSGQVFAVEALVRWQHPTRGLITPAQFIPLAEESGLIVPLGDWVLNEACRQAKAWQRAGLPPVGVCVNVSARQFRDKGWITRVSNALAESGLEPKYLELELTESMLMQDVERAIAIMVELQALGVQFAIDDFGTGYSSLSALKNFPVARLKIDQSFVRNLPDDADDRGIAAAVISLGQKLNMRVIAEGVETEAQRDFLRANHCDEMQGYYFSRPVSADAISALLGTSPGDLPPEAH